MPAVTFFDKSSLSPVGCSLYRIPCTYLGCASGTIGTESGSGSKIGDVIQDGALYTNSQTRHRDFTDGLTNTMLSAEALFLPGVVGPDRDGSPQIIDHLCRRQSPSHSGIDLQVGLERSGY